MFNGPLPFIVVLLAAAAISGTVSVYALKFRRTPIAPPLIGLLACAAFYAFGYALELSSSTLAHMLFWNKVQYIGIPFIPVFWILLCARFSGRDVWLRRPFVALLFTLSAATLALDFTNAAHHLFYRAIGISTAGPFPVIVLDKGPWYWIHVAYTNLALLGGTIILLRMWRRSAGPYRRQTSVFLIGAGLPWLGFLVYILNLSPYHLDTTPLGLALAGPIIAWGLFRYRILDLAPVARDSVFASMRDGAIVFDLQSRIVDFNSAARKVLPALSSAAIGKRLEEAVLGQDELAALLRTGGREEASIRIGEADRARYYQARLSAVANRRRTLMGRVLILSDSTEQILLMRRLEDLATIDELTGAYNRRHFMSVGKAEVARAWRYGHPISLIILDLDHFKRVNDTWGHEAGDRVLRDACRTIKSALRSVDILGRHGGEEFAILLPETPPDQAAGVAERLRAALAEHAVAVTADASVSFTASIGVAGTDKIGEESIDILIRTADAAMYRAKDAGRNCVRTAALPV